MTVDGTDIQYSAFDRDTAFRCHLCQRITIKYVLGFKCLPDTIDPREKK